MKLKVGIMKLRDLSMWFGLKPDTISNSSKTAKEKKFKTLEKFCKFHFEGKKLYIDEVYIEEYSKALQIIEEHFDDEWGNITDYSAPDPNWQRKQKIDSAARVGEAIYYKFPEVNGQVKQTTAKSYASKVRRERYGRVYKDEMGSRGYCEMVYLNEEQTGLLPEDQMKILKQCRQEAYQGINEEIAKIDECFHDGEIGVREYKEALSELNTLSYYKKYEELLEERLGFIPIKRTKLYESVLAESQSRSS